MVERLGAPGFSLRAPCAASLPKPRRKALLNVRRRFGEEVEIGANHRGMMSLARRFVTLCGAESAPLVLGRRCPISFPYRTRFEWRSDAMGKAGKFGPVGPSERPKDTLAVASDAAEASENVVRAASLSEGSLVSLALFGAGPRPAALQALGPLDPGAHISSGDPGNRAEASDRDAAGASSPAPPEFAGAAAAGTLAKLGRILSSGPAAQAWGARHARHAKAAEDRAPSPAVGSNAPALPASVGAERQPPPGQCWRAVRPEAQSSPGRAG